MKSFFILFCLLSYSAFTQNATLYVGPSIKYASLNLKASPASTINFRYSYSAGAQGSLFLKNKHEILLSFMYTDFSYNTTYHYYTGSLTPDKNVPLKAINHYGYFAPSLGYNFHINIQEKHSIYLGLSAGSLLLIDNNNKTTFQDNSVRKNDFAEKKLLCASPQIGYTFSPSQNMKISLGLYYTVFSKELDHTQLDPAYGYGANINVLLRLGKNKQ